MIVIRSERVLDSASLQICGFAPASFGTSSILNTKNKFAICCNHGKVRSGGPHG